MGWGGWGVGVKACGACHPRNDFWSCPFALYVVLQVLSFPLRVFVGFGCGALAAVADVVRVGWWCITCCGLCASASTAPAKAGCSYYLASNASAPNPDRQYGMYVHRRVAAWRSAIDRVTASHPFALQVIAQLKVVANAFVLPAVLWRR